MRHQLSLCLTASFLFLNQGAQGSNLHNDDDKQTVGQGAGVTQVSPTVKAGTSSTSQALHCYRVIRGKKYRLFDDGGKFLDRRILVRDPAVPSVVTLSSSQPRDALPSDQQEPQSLIQKTRQPGNITGLHFLLQTVLLEWLSAAPVERNNLLRTCRYYRAFFMPIMEETHFISLSLRKELLISAIGVQTGDAALFLRDQQATFAQCSIKKLREILTLWHYKDTLSPNSEHRKVYKSIGSQSVTNWGGIKRLDLASKKLHFVPLNFDGAEGIQELNLRYNQLRIPPALSKNTALSDLNLMHNQLDFPPDLSKNWALSELLLVNSQLSVPPDLSKNTALKILNLSENQLKAAPDLSQNKMLSEVFLTDTDLRVPPDFSKNTALRNLNLSRNPLTAAPDFSKNTALKMLFLMHNELRVSPDFSKNTALSFLAFSENKLTVAPDFSKNTALKVLDLSQNQLTVAPSFSKNTALEHLDLSQNALTTVPDFSQNTALKGLILSRNQLPQSPLITGLTNLKSLELDDSLCVDETLLNILRTLNNHREDRNKVTLTRISKNARGGYLQAAVKLD